MFFLSTFALALPFFVLGALTGIELLPGLPVAALMFICPLLAAMILLYQEQRSRGVSILLQRAFDFRRITAKVWYLPMCFLMPVVSVVAFVVLRLQGTAVPMPQIAALPTLLLCGVFFIACSRTARSPSLATKDTQI